MLSTHSPSTPSSKLASIRFHAIIPLTPPLERPRHQSQMEGSSIQDRVDQLQAHILFQIQDCNWKFQQQAQDFDWKFQQFKESQELEINSKLALFQVKNSLLMHTQKQYLEAMNASTREDVRVWAPPVLRVTVGEALLTELFGDRDTKGGGSWFESREEEIKVKQLAELFDMEVHSFAQAADAAVESSKVAHFSTLSNDKKILDCKKILTKYPFLRGCITSFQALAIDTLDL